LTPKQGFAADNDGDNAESHRNQGGQDGPARTDGYCLGHDGKFRWRHAFDACFGLSTAGSSCPQASVLSLFGSLLPRKNTLLRLTGKVGVVFEKWSLFWFVEHV
jgi:hypothetical protein